MTTTHTAIDILAADLAAVAMKGKFTSDAAYALHMKYPGSLAFKALFVATHADDLVFIAAMKRGYK